jgi:thiol-disulfide isomerase/thioredoxin
LKNRRVSWLGAAFLAGCAVILLWWTGLPDSPDYFVNDGELLAVPVRGGLLPPFEGQTLSGQTLSINEDFNRPLIINFWATWCVPCVEEMPALETLYQAGLPVVGVNVGLEESAAVENWIDAVGITFPIVVDDSARTLEALYRIRAMPTTFFIDSDGIIQKVEAGALTESSLEEGLIAMGIENYE